MGVFLGGLLFSKKRNRSQLKSFWLRYATPRYLFDNDEKINNIR